MIIKATFDSTNGINVSKLLGIEILKHVKVQPYTWK